MRAEEALASGNTRGAGPGAANGGPGVGRAGRGGGAGRSAAIAGAQLREAGTVSGARGGEAAAEHGLGGLGRDPRRELETFPAGKLPWLWAPAGGQGRVPGGWIGGAGGQEKGM